MTTTTAQKLLEDGFTRVAETVAGVTADSDARLLSYRPDNGSNSVAWLVWHLARVQDDHLADLAAVLADRMEPATPGEHRVPTGQQWDDGGWADRFALPYGRHDTGFGHGAADVAAFSATDGALLAGYHAAVHEATLAVIANLSDADFDKIVDRRWEPAVTSLSRLVSVLNDTTQHAGQAAYVRGLAERAR
ncbi:MAG TPA: DinB family protein [Arthrobacter sp.]|nr:DinB family protein [Arthrobacter sp.]